MFEVVEHKKTWTCDSWGDMVDYLNAFKRRTIMVIRHNRILYRKRKGVVEVDALTVV